MLEFTEEALDLISVFVKRFEKSARLFPIGFIGNIRADLAFVQGVNKVISIVSFIGEHDCIWRNSFNQIIDSR